MLLAELQAQMVVIPPGRFEMGSLPGQGEDEQPVHAVTVASFMMSRYEVSASQFAIFEKATGRTPVGDGSSGERRPAANISWDDAVAFIKWLNALGGTRYRLPSEAEWEYAARGGLATAYWWGDSYQQGRVNGSGLGGADVWAETAPVDTLAANAYGLYHVLGNVWEWTADCYFPDYDGATPDGSARKGDDACGRVLRGGSWSDTPVWLRASTRNWFDRTERFDYVGFRLAADLPSSMSGAR
ncbi:MAG: SUMF1/EgtB/PvdO family nonheme iron enzyme [Steroidobacteraceae bacterium]